MQKVVYLSLGSNVGDRAAQLTAAIAALASLGEVAKVSAFYETEPLEFTKQPWFLNCVVKLQTEKMPRQLLAALLAIERQHGRNRSKERSKGPRTIDLDILLFGNSVIETRELTVPHPAMHQRRFVLEPLAEIAPEVRHPVLKRTIQNLLSALPPGQAAKKIAME
jgi:2-amino-4-hydroxy-6-hydroxymethyldihydropteridine diphosphokinase